MNMQIRIKPNLIVVDGRVKTTSLDVAEKFGKRHTHVLRTINNLECSKKFTETNFGLSEYEDSTGRKLPIYEITKDGFIFLVMGFTGKLAARIKEKYIAAFNRMEDELKKQWLAAKLQASKVRLGDWTAITELMAKAGNRENPFSKILNNLGFTKEGPIPEKYQAIPPARIIRFVDLSREGNHWAANLLKRTQDITVPVLLPQSQ
ncbi:Rha family transcriptional regulator [bacterium]|nr:Rha family transcriptional regulator [bacterium]